MYNMVKYNYTQGIFFVFVTAINLEFLFKYFFTTHSFPMKILLTRVTFICNRFSGQWNQLRMCSLQWQFRERLPVWHTQKQVEKHHRFLSLTEVDAKRGETYQQDALVSVTTKKAWSGERITGWIFREQGKMDWSGTRNQSWSPSYLLQRQTVHPESLHTRRFSQFLSQHGREIGDATSL